MSRTTQSKLRRARVEARLKMLTGIAAATLAIMPAVTVFAQTAGGDASAAAAPSNPSTTPGQTTPDAGAGSTDATPGQATTPAPITGGSSAAGTGDATGTATPGTSSTDQSGAAATPPATTPDTSSSTAAPATPDTSSSATPMATTPDAGAAAPPAGTSGSTDAMGAGSSTSAMSGSSTPMAMPMSSGSSMSGDMSSMPMLNYRVLDDPNLSMSLLARAHAYGLSDGKIAEAYALAHQGLVPLSYVLDQVENGTTYSEIAQNLGVSLKSVRDQNTYLSRIQDYRAAYNVTGRGALKMMAMNGGMGMPMSSGTPMTSGTPMSSAPAMPSMPPATPDATPPAATSANTASQPITDVLRSDGRFTQLSSLITAAGLDSYLRQSGPFTLFAPTDAAIAKLPASTISALQQDPNKLSKLLQYHLVGQSAMPNDIAAMSSPSLTTIAGPSLNVTSSNGQVTVNGNPVTQAPITASNGVIYPIDTVLMPPDASASPDTSGSSSSSSTSGSATQSSTTPTDTTTAPAAPQPSDAPVPGDTTSPSAPLPTGSGANPNTQGAVPSTPTAPATP